MLRGSVLGPRTGLYSPISTAPIDLDATLLNVYGALEVWRLDDILSGTAILASSNVARNGVLSGWTLQNMATPLSTLAPLSHTGDSGTIDTANLRAAWNGNIGAILIFGQTTVWADATNRRLFFVRSNASNIIDIFKVGATLTARYIAGGVAITQPSGSISITTFFSTLLTWNKAANRARQFVNGVQLGTDQAIAGVWSNAFDAGVGSSIRIGSGISAAGAIQQSWDGGIFGAAVWAGVEPSIADAAAIHNLVL
jgi:hypothetical protein